MRYHERYGAFFPRITPVVKYLVIVNSVIFFIQLLLRPQWSALLGLAPAPSGRLRLATAHSFLHGECSLFFNMLVLMSGSTLKQPGAAILKFNFICSIGADCWALW
jgi:hypothetical protein